MSIDIEYKTACVSPSNEFEISTQSAVDVCTLSAEASVIARKKEYSIVGDAVYVSSSIDEIPEWMTSILDQLAGNVIDSFGSTLAGIQSSFNTAIYEINLAKNTYTDSIISKETIDGMIISRLQGVNATLGNIQSNYIDLTSVVATLDGTLSNRTTQLESSLGSLHSTVTTQAGTIITLQDGLDAFSDYTNDQLHTLSTVLGYQISQLEAANGALSAAITDMQTVVVDKTGAVAADYNDVTVAQDNNGNDIELSIRDFNVAINTIGYNSMSIAHTGHTVVASDNSTAAIFLQGVDQQAGTWTGSTRYFDYSSIGNTTAIKNAMYARSNELRDAGLATPQDTPANRRLRQDYLNQANLVKIRADFLYAQATAVGTQAQSFGMEHEFKQGGVTKSKGGFVFTNNGSQVLATFSADRIQLGRPVGGVYPIVINDSDVIIDQYRKADVVIPSTTSFTAATGKTYMFFKSSNTNISFLFPNPVVGSRIDIISCDTGTLAITSPTIAKNKNKIEGGYGATFIYAAGSWQSIGSKA